MKLNVSRYHENYKEEIKEIGLSDITIPMEDIRILWNVNKKGLITEIEIIRFPKGKIEEWPCHLHRLYTFDIGNSELGWEENYTLSTLLMRFFHDYGFADKNVAEKFIKDLASVAEFRLEVEAFLFPRLA